MTFSFHSLYLFSYIAENTPEMVPLHHIITNIYPYLGKRSYCHPIQNESLCSEQKQTAEILSNIRMGVVFSITLIIDFFLKPL